MGDDESGLRTHKYFSKAIEAAKNHPEKDNLSSLHGCVLVKSNNILAIETNKPKRNSFVDIFRHHQAANIHSEIAAILYARNKTDLRGSKIYVARIKKQDGSVSNSKPCLLCSRALKSYGIKRVYFSISENEYGIMRPADIKTVVINSNIKNPNRM